MAEKKVLSFNKRISLTKKETFESLIKDAELEKIASERRDRNTGYYSLKEIFKALNPVLDKYDLDIDLVIKHESIDGIWYDCSPDSDKERVIPIDFEQLKDLPRLSAMKNLVQSNGAVKTYLRRYTLTNMLNLNATDIIEQNPQGDGNKDNNYGSKGEDALQTILHWVLLNISDKDKKKAGEMLVKYSAFKGKDGKEVPGISDHKKLKGRRLEVVYSQIKKENPELTIKMAQEYDKKLEELKKKSN